jgi:hypothetical protein
VKLEDIKQPYNLIASLGSACGPASYLRKYNLRRFSMPLDWVASMSLSDVNRLLQNRFGGYMNFENLKLIDGQAHFVENEIIQPTKSYFVKDTYYNIISVHDFPVLPNQIWHANYPSFKEKLDFRIGRFIENIIHRKSILFVRWLADYHEVVELRSILSEITQGELNILIVNPVEGVTDVVELDWGLKGVCSVAVPMRSENNNVIWDRILNGILLI